MTFNVTDNGSVTGRLGSAAAQDNDRYISSESDRQQLLIRCALAEPCQSSAAALWNYAITGFWCGDTLREDVHDCEAQKKTLRHVRSYTCLEGQHPLTWKVLHAEAIVDFCGRLICV